MTYKKAILIMHLTVIIYGFTGIIGKVVELDAIRLVWLRLIIASVSSYITLKIKKESVTANSLRDYFHFLFIGIFLASHWFTFFHAINISNISIALIGFATNPIFTAIIEPLLNKEKYKRSDSLTAFISFLGIIIIFNNIQMSANMLNGFVFGILSGLLATLFTIYNRKMVKSYSPVKISFFQLAYAMITLSFFIDRPTFILDIKALDWILVIVLGTICTGFAHTLNIFVMKVIKAYDVALITNLEPVYSILLALLFFPETESMNISFYVGSLLVILSVLIKPILIRKQFTRKF